MSDPARYFRKNAKETDARLPRSSQPLHATSHPSGNCHAMQENPQEHTTITLQEKSQQTLPMNTARQGSSLAQSATRFSHKSRMPATYPNTSRTRIEADPMSTTGHYSTQTQRPPPLTGHTTSVNKTPRRQSLSHQNGKSAQRANLIGARLTLPIKPINLNVVAPSNSKRTSTSLRSLTTSSKLATEHPGDVSFVPSDEGEKVTPVKRSLSSIRLAEPTKTPRKTSVKKRKTKNGLPVPVDTEPIKMSLPEEGKWVRGEWIPSAGSATPSLAGRRGNSDLEDLQVRAAGVVHRKEASLTTHYTGSPKAQDNGSHESR